MRNQPLDESRTLQQLRHLHIFIRRVRLRDAAGADDD
jgi:hypothetical protein